MGGAGPRLVASVLVPVAEAVGPLPPGAPRAPVAPVPVDKGAVAVTVTSLEKS